MRCTKKLIAETHDGEEAARSNKNPVVHNVHDGVKDEKLTRCATD
jgi:hypothetical protein